MIGKIGAVLVLATLAAGPAGAQTNPFLGKWDITATTPKGSYPYWLEVREEQGRLVGFFLNRWASVTKLPEIAVEGQHLVFSVGLDSAHPERVKPVHRARVENGKLVGELTTATGTVAWVGVRPPAWGTYDANAAHKYDAPIALFNGRDLSGWRFQHADKPPGWSVTDGILTNETEGNNIISTPTFGAFRLVVEYKLEPKSNSGITCAVATSCRCSTTRVPSRRRRATWASTAASSRRSTPASRPGSGRGRTSRSSATA